MQHWQEALEAIESCLALAREHRAGLQEETGYLADLAEALSGLGEHARARQAAEESVEMARRRKTRFFELRAQLALARVLRAAQGLAAKVAIDAALARTAALLDDTGARAYSPAVHEEQAALAALVGDRSAQQRHLREAHRLFSEMGAVGHAERLAKEIGL
jgi:hypothetical protein